MPSVPPPAASIEWSRLDNDLSVATRNGEFAGYVDRRSPGTFLVFDRDSRYFGTFDDEGTARSVLGESAPARRGPVALPGARLLRALSSRLMPLKF